MTNIKAAQRAKRPAAVYGVEQNMDNEPLGTIVCDLLVDLLHLSDTLTEEEDDAPGGAPAMLERIAMHYYAEREED